MDIITLKTNKQFHQFNPAVIYAYYNLADYPYEIKNEYILVERRKEIAVFLLDQRYQLDVSGFQKKVRYYTDVLPDKTKYKTTKTFEYLYNLTQLFSKTTKQNRRGQELTKRVDISITDLDVDNPVVSYLINRWELHKKNDPKVYQMLFDAKRYERCFKLKKKGFNIYQKLILVKGQPYGIICFSLNGSIAFELAFISLYWDKELKIINDLNGCILINCFYDLYQNYGIEYVNPGTDAGIKGLKVFKGKLPFEKIVYYNYVNNEVDKK